MTDTRKAVTRRTINPAPNIRRKLAVTIGPGDVITFREHGRRKRFSAELHRAYATVVRWHADAELSKRRKEQATRRKVRWRASNT